MSYRGLGVMYKTDPGSGNVIDCDSWSNVFQSVCWNPFAPTVIAAPPGSSGGGSGDGSDTPVQPLQAAIGLPVPTSGGSSTLVYVALGIAALALFMGMGGRR